MRWKGKLSLSGQQMSPCKSDRQSRAWAWFCHSYSLTTSGKMKCAPASVSSSVYGHFMVNKDLELSHHSKVALPTVKLEFSFCTGFCCPRGDGGGNDGRTHAPETVLAEVMGRDVT